MKRRIVRFLHGLVTFVEVAGIVIAMLYAGFSLWDNNLVYNQVENATKGLRQIKALEGDDPLSMFDQLRFINPDVHAWVEMNGTAIDYPVLQGSSNFSYINTDVYGNFALAGSIFMDYRNSTDFSDRYTLLMGHDMAGHRMFSDVNLYKEEAFFRKNQQGTLTLMDGPHQLLNLSCFVTSASNSLIFNPMNWNHLTGAQILKAVQDGALYVNPEGMRILCAMIGAGMDVRLVALSTCSTEYTDARAVLLTILDPMDVSVNIQAPGYLVPGECME